MASVKIYVFLMICFVAGAQSNVDSCKLGLKKLSNEIDQQMNRMHQHIQAMAPVLKDFMWNTFELEYQVKEMRDRFARLEKNNEYSQPDNEPVVPTRKAVEFNVPSIFVRPGQSTVGSIGGKLNSLLENNSHSFDNLTSDVSN